MPWFPRERRRHSTEDDEEHRNGEAKDSGYQVCPILDVNREPPRVECEEEEGGGEGVVKIEENRFLAEVVKCGATACDQLEGAESVLA